MSIFIFSSFYNGGKQGIKGLALMMNEPTYNIRVSSPGKKVKSRMLVNAHFLTETRHVPWGMRSLRSPAEEKPVQMCLSKWCSQLFSHRTVSQ